MTEIDKKTQNSKEQDAADIEKRGERVAVIDYKMVTFSLAGKDYAIDIMQVKEIAKAGRFTFVPNTSNFVMGVYNLRGDIIPIIDLRIFFNIPTKSRETDALESMIIINVEEQTFGIVVDAIDKVVGISKSTIQPPHPIFGDINIKYIYGVVENQNRLYILLDVGRIFGTRVKEIENAKIDVVVEKPELKKQTLASKSSEELDISFIQESLASLVKFYVTSVNNHWVASRYQQWKDERPAGDVQLKSEDEARQYLQPFYSPENGMFWSDAYASGISALLPSNQAKQINVWNVGCGKGFESYSLAVLLKEKYPNARIRIYANDSDLLAISNAPMLGMSAEQITQRYKPFLVQGVGGSWTFSQAIKEMILFEYHDCTNQNSVPNMDIIVSRDVLSFMNSKNQTALIEDFTEKLKDNGIVILGKNEAMPQKSGWTRTVQDDIIVFSKE